MAFKYDLFLLSLVFFCLVCIIFYLHACKTFFSGGGCLCDPCTTLQTVYFGVYHRCIKPDLTFFRVLISNAFIVDRICVISPAYTLSY